LMPPTPARWSRRRCALRWPGLGPARHPPHCRVLARNPRRFRARLSNPPGPPAQGAGLGGDRHHRSGQPPAKAIPACILCLQEERRVGNDNTVKWRGLPLQIPSCPFRAHFVPIPCARWRACTSVPTGSWRSSMVHTAWQNTDPMDHRVMMPTGRVTRFGGHRADGHRSGQLMCRESGQADASATRFRGLHGCRPSARWGRRRALRAWMGLDDRGHLGTRRRRGLTRVR
jgi:hypothetical protein